MYLLEPLPGVERQSESIAGPVRGGAWRWLKPSLADIVFGALLLWLVLFTIQGDGQLGLLQDAGTGYHIRTGDYILEHGAVPHRDIFSFSKPGEPWFAWEWLSAVLFALAHRYLGLKGVMILCGGAIALSSVIVLRHMVWRGTNFLVAIAMAHLVVAASSLHYLARPHVFTFVFLAAALWLIDADRRRPSPRIWYLIPLTILWANLHGGFLALPASLAILAAGSAIEWLLFRENRPRAYRMARRYGLLAAACLAASGVNPYGFAVHAHAIPYLGQKWLLDMVQEFQSMNFQSSGAAYVEVLLFAGAALSARLLSQRQIAPAILILAWGHAALTSMRHIPIFALVSAPLLGREATRLWNSWMRSAKPGSTRAIFGAMAADHTRGLARSSIWTPALVLLLALFSFGWGWPADFPETRYPAPLIGRNAELISGARIFTTDSWADYLIYRFYPRQRIFVDGRSDFFGREISEQYVQILKGQYGWDALMERHGFDVALIPSQSALASLLRASQGWRMVEEDSQAVLFQRVN